MSSATRFCAQKRWSASAVTALDDVVTAVEQVVALRQAKQDPSFVIQSLCGASARCARCVHSVA